MSEQAATEELSDTERRIKWLENELSMLTKAGIIEVAVRNLSVAEYMKHWEGRTEKAEAALSTARQDALEEAIRWHKSEAKMYWGVWENAQNMEHQEARFDAQFHDKAAEKLRALKDKPTA